ncbi:hypothetical protein NP493_718g03006 [Ridgeia piscesae]|uniref:Neurotransmitter-gated ion-channel ligand-binding domain-containing protein n=1 Tax=Ridgeia piscesae TaxID=27915 RepID=A0AAD9KQQ4_RIDPI|nr:hypothetical protein NP493_718g03006 [Ridgeia piscesae]
MPYKDIIVGRPRQVQAGPWMSLVSVTSTERADVVSNCDANKGGLRVICNASSHVRIPGGCCRVWFSLSKAWTDYKLSWNPGEYGGVTRLYVPSDEIWLPDIVLYNNADSNCEVTCLICVCSADSNCEC